MTQHHGVQGWGFLARSMRVTINSIVKDMGEIHDALLDERCDVTGVRLLRKSVHRPHSPYRCPIPISHACRQVLLQHRPRSEPSARTGNVVLGCFVTAYARLHLLSFLRHIGETYGPQALQYCDTVAIDSHPGGC